MKTTSNINENTSITKKDLIKVFLRSCTLEASFNYERMQSLGLAFSMAPIIKKLYKTKEDRSKAMKRHLEFFNTTPHLSSFIMGISTAMEEKNSKDENFEEDSINAVKIGLMGPLAGIGDSVFWGTLRVIAAGVGTSLAVKGNILGAILFLLIFNVPHYALRYLGAIYGYKIGSSILTKVQSSGLMSKITYGASILGMLVIGAMSATMVTFETPLKFQLNGSVVKIQEILNGIFPSILPLALTGFIYYLLKKKVKVGWILGGLVVFGVLGKIAGLL